LREKGNTFFGTIEKHGRTLKTAREIFLYSTSLFRKGKIRNLVDAGREKRDSRVNQ